MRGRSFILAIAPVDCDVGRAPVCCLLNVVDYRDVAVIDGQVDVDDVTDRVLALGIYSVEVIPRCRIPRVLLDAVLREQIVPDGIVSSIHSAHDRHDSCVLLGVCVSYRVGVKMRAGSDMQTVCPWDDI